MSSNFGMYQDSAGMWHPPIRRTGKSESILEEDQVKPPFISALTTFKEDAVGKVFDTDCGRRVTCFKYIPEKLRIENQFFRGSFSGFTAPIISARVRDPGEYHFMNIKNNEVYIVKDTSHDTAKYTHVTDTIGEYVSPSEIQKMLYKKEKIEMLERKLTHFKNEINNENEQITRAKNIILNASKRIEYLHDEEKKVENELSLLK
jgi:hypothetical protein